MNDDLSAIVGGFVATTVVTFILLLAEVVTPLDLRPFATIAAFVGTAENTLLGFLIFFAAGTFAWALLFVTLGPFLPGETGAVRGMAFSVVLWIGFVLAFSSGIEALALFVVFTLVAHLAYGFTLGAVYDRYADHTFEEV